VPAGGGGAASTGADADGVDGYDLVGDLEGDGSDVEATESDHDLDSNPDLDAADTDDDADTVDLDACVSGKKKRKFKPLKWVKRRLGGAGKSGSSNLTVPGSAGNVAVAVGGGGGGDSGGGAAAERGLDVAARKDSVAGLLGKRRGRGTSVRDKHSNAMVSLERKLSFRSSPKELTDRNIIWQESEEEAAERKNSLKAILKRRLSQRLSLREMLDKKILHFDEYVDVYQTWGGHHYDRTGDKPWCALTMADKIAIKAELNAFKASEMEVHDESKKHTRFHK
jgi:phosphatase and actin regulator 4